MTCKLCLAEKTLKLSHIIPKFAYKPTNDPKNRSIIIYKESISNWIQSGVKIPLLCDDCEQLLCSYEKELSKFLKALQKKDPQFFSERTNGKDTILFSSGFDFDKIKKAIISIIWRLGLPDCSNPIKTDSLGKYEEIFRQICLNDKPLSVKSFPIYAQKVTHENNFIDGIIATYNLGYIGILGERKILLDGVMFHLFLSENGEKIPSSYDSLILGGTYSPITFISLDDVVAQTSPLLDLPKINEVVAKFSESK